MRQGARETRARARARRLSPLSLPHHSLSTPTHRPPHPAAQLLHVCRRVQDAAGHQERTVLAHQGRRHDAAAGSAGLEVRVGEEEEEAAQGAGREQGGQVALCVDAQGGDGLALGGGGRGSGGRGRVLSILPPAAAAAAATDLGPQRGRPPAHVVAHLVPQLDAQGQLAGREVRLQPDEEAAEAAAHVRDGHPGRGPPLGRRPGEGLGVQVTPGRFAGCVGQVGVVAVV